MTITHLDGVVEIQNFLSDDECNNLISFLNANDASDENWGSPCFPLQAKKLGKGSVKPVLTDGIEIDTIVNLEHRIKTHAENLFSVKLNTYMFKGQHHQGAPRGDSTNPSAYYNVAAFVYLNDNFIGGNFVMPALDLEIKPVKGSLIILLEDEQRQYGVTTVTEGHRYSIQGSFMFDHLTISDFKWLSSKGDR